MSQATSINYRLEAYSVITAFLYATQSLLFPAAKYLSTLQFVALTQVSLLVSLPLLMSRQCRRDFLALIESPSTTAIWNHIRHRIDRPPAL
jgi:hypothetical protein